jgi:hypothetical protein
MGAIPVVVGAVFRIDVVSVPPWMGSKRSFRPNPRPSRQPERLLVSFALHPLEIQGHRSFGGRTGRPAQTGVLSHPLSSPRCQSAEAEATSAPGFVPSLPCAVKAHILLTFSTPRRPLSGHWISTHWTAVTMPLQQARWNYLSWVLRHRNGGVCSKVVEISP